MAAARKSEEVNQTYVLGIPPLPPGETARKLSRSLSCNSLIRIPELDDSLESETQPQTQLRQSNSDTQAARVNSSDDESLENVQSEPKSEVPPIKNPSPRTDLIKAIDLPERIDILTSEEVNQRADDFIADFRQKMKIERQESYEQYQQRIARSAGP